MVRKFFKDYFTFTRSERNGIIILLSLLLLLIAIRAAISFLLPAGVTVTGQFEEELAHFESNLVFAEQSEVADSFPPVITPFVFDPNEAGEADLLSLGLDRFVVDNLLKYREKGGRFYSPRDMKKIYGMEKETFDILEPFIRIGSFSEDAAIDKAERFDSAGSNGQEGFVKGAAGTGKNRRNGEHSFRGSGPAILLNQADTADLAGLPGIGPVLSGRIIRYRELLGGYYKKEQLLEVYRLTPERFEKIAGLVSVDTGGIRTIDVNQLNPDSLPYHPYLTDYQLRAIIKYRDLNGRFERIGEIRDSRLLPEEVFDRMKFYLTVE